MTAAEYRSLIREVPDFPKPGILFYDVTTLLKNPKAFTAIADDLVAYYGSQRVAKVVGIESRGFIYGGILAQRLTAGFVPVRKPGKLPADCFEVKYSLEYGSNSLAIHRDAWRKDPSPRRRHDNSRERTGSVPDSVRAAETWRRREIGWRRRR